MARDFDGVDDYVDAAVSALTRPCTVVGLVRTETNAEDGNQGLVAHDSGANDGWRVTIAGAAADADFLRLTFGGVALYDFTSLTFTVNTWYFFGVVVPANSGTATGYLGTLGATPSSATAVVGTMTGTPSRFEIGGLNWFAASLNGQMAEVAAYDGALTAADMAILAEGISPLLVKPETLVHYFPLWGGYTTEPNLFGGAGGTVSGALKADHPAVIYPTRQKLILPAAAAGGVTIPPLDQGMLTGGLSTLGGGLI